MTVLVHLSVRAGVHRSLALLTERGEPFNHGRIANLWRALFVRIGKRGDCPPFRPFKFLRKTAAQLVREASDGEIAGVFLCHGRPAGGDELLDAYTNRPFDRVATALATVRLRLESMLAAAE